MQDILTGGEEFKENPQEQFMQINEIRKKTEYFDCNDDAELLYAKFKGKQRVKAYRKILYALTHRGECCPRLFFKKNSVALEWYPPKENFMMTKEVKVYNLFSGKYSIRKFSTTKSIKLRLEFYKLLNEIYNKYDYLQKCNINAHKEFSTMEFWKNYLELK
jgi:hypothetical protein